MSSNTVYHSVYNLFDNTTLTCGICMYEWSCDKCYKKFNKSINKNKKFVNTSYEKCGKCNTHVVFKIN